MKPIERDALLIRLDERSESFLRELQDLNGHQEKANGHILGLFKEQGKSKVEQATMKGRINRNWLFIRIAGSILGIILTAVLALQLFISRS